MATKQRATGVAVITGAANGMGGASARLMAEAGWPELLICDLDAGKLEAAAAPLRDGGAKVDVLAGDVTAADWPQRLLAMLAGREIGALIHAAGIAPQMGTPDRVFEINLDASLRLLATARGHMAAGSAVVLFASIAGSFPVPDDARAAFEAPIPPEGCASIRHFAKDANDAYLLSKRAIVATVKREARSLYAERQARIVAVSPGMIDTAMTQGVRNALTDALFGQAAIDRYGVPEEVAAVCVFLCSPAASFITGCDIRVDGGELAGLGI